MYYLYILKSRDRNWYYVGITSDTGQRLSEHNTGKSKSTKPYKPLNVVYLESYTTKTECRKRELFIKNNHAAKKALIQQISLALSSNG